MTETSLPDGWMELPVQKLARITTGSRDTKDRENNGEYPFFVRSQTIERINSIGFDGEGVLTAGDGVGTGKIFHYINGKCDFHQRVYLMHSFSPEISGRYFFFYFSSFFYDRIMSMTAKSSVDSVRREMIADMMVRCPVDPNEQRRIVEALSDADALIEGLERLIVKKRLVKQGAMQDLLTAKRRLPGFSGEWETKRLGDIAQVIMGQSPRSAAYNGCGQGLPLIQGAADVKARKTIGRVYTTEVTKLGKTGDIILTVRAPVGEVSKAIFDLCLGRGVCAVRTDSEFLYHALINAEGAWGALSKGSTFDSVTSDEVRAFEVQYPLCSDERGAIANVLSDMDAETQALETRLEKARQVKEGMMQNLLTGRIRLV